MPKDKEILEEYEKGLGYTEIARKYNVSRQRAYQVIKKYTNKKTVYYKPILNLKKIREDRKLTQAKLIELSNIPRSTYLYLESKRVMRVTEQTAKKICKALDLKLDEAFKPVSCIRDKNNRLIEKE